MANSSVRNHALSKAQFRLTPKFTCIAPFFQTCESLQRLHTRSPGQALSNGVRHLRHGLILRVALSEARLSFEYFETDIEALLLLSRVPNGLSDCILEAAV